jgi:hypothetical protein
MVFGTKVFSRKGNFLARDVDPPLGDITRSAQKSPVATDVSRDVETRCVEINNVRVRVLKPDSLFINDISKRLARFDSHVKKLTSENHPEN